MKTLGIYFQKIFYIDHTKKVNIIQVIRAIEKIKHLPEILVIVECFFWEVAMMEPQVSEFELKFSA